MIEAQIADPPAWLEKLTQAFDSATSSHATSTNSPLLDAFEPLIRRARDRVREGIRTLLLRRPESPVDPETTEPLLFASLPDSLLMMCTRTLVLEMHVARLEGLLAGATPEERFQSFLHRLRRRDVVGELLREYPVLARQMAERLELWVDASVEFVGRLCSSWEAIVAMFHRSDHPGPLVNVAANMGDSHRGGRSVLIAEFRSGLRVVYKPRSMAVDVRFQELLSFLNSRGASPSFQTLKVLDCGSHGWVEFVAAGACTSASQLRRFYQRMGGYLALLYALEATDFHFENLIASGEHAILVDLEALFQARIGETNAGQGSALGAAALADSVLRSGLMPNRIWANGDSEGLDLSGLGTPAGQLTPFDVPQWEQGNTDQMRLTRRPIPMEAGQNRPTLNGAEVEVPPYTDAIVSGFTRIYDLLVKSRAELLADEGPLAAFADCEVRAILRATRTYGVVLHESFHPDVLRDGLRRDRLFDHLWDGVQKSPFLAQVVPAEIDDLQRGDIPIFTTRPSSRDLWSSSGQRIANFFDESAMTLVWRRIQHFSEQDKDRQGWMIQASLSTLVDTVAPSQWPAYPAVEAAAAPNRGQLLSACCAIADRLEAQALRSQEQVAWIGLVFTGERHGSLVPLGPDLYDGLPGIALYLAYLGAVSGESRYTALARGTLATVRQIVAEAHSPNTPIGAFDGLGGIIYLLTHLGALWNEPALFAEAQDLVALLPALVDRDDRLDLIGGAAGSICALASLYDCSPSDRTLAAAIRCGDHLIGRAIRMEDGIGWLSQAAPKPLTGFSHGAAGIAWALLRLAGLTDAERFRDQAVSAIRYERSLFSADRNNWPDLRENMGPQTGNGQGFAVTWCHGAPGIGLSRAVSLTHLDDADTRCEITAAVRATVARGLVGNHSLCHGDLGNLECLHQAALVLNDSACQSEVERRAGIIVESIQRDGWLCGNPSRVESPGLMSGLAGIGYGLLRLASPERIPSVLALASPVGRR